MTSTDQPLVSPTVRNCANCSSPAMLNVAQDDFNQYQCTSCGKAISLSSLKDLALQIVFAVALLAWLYYDDDHLFWLLWEVVSNPIQQLKSMAVDGPWAPLWLPLGLIAVNLILVALPVGALVVVINDVYTRLRNPIAKGERAQAALAGHKFAEPIPSPRFTWAELAKSIALAIGFHAVFIALAWGALKFGNPDALEDVMRNSLKGMLFGGGLFLAVRRWMIAVAWYLLLPVSAYILALASGQLS